MSPRWLQNFFGGKQEQASASAAPAHLRLGRKGEDAARALLERSGMKVLATNWREGRLELDIVCRDADTIVFVEVKTRSQTTHGGPAAALTPAKQRTLCRAARAWLAAHDAWSSPCRFDVVCVVREGDTLHLEHYRHAFECEPTVDSGNATWQPW